MDVSDNISLEGGVAMKVCAKQIQGKKIGKEELEIVYIDNSYKGFCWKGEQKWDSGWLDKEGFKMEETGACLRGSFFKVG